MSTKRGRSPSLTDDVPPAKRGNNETGDQPTQLHVNAPGDTVSLATAVHAVSIATESAVPIAEPAEAQGATQNEINTVQTDMLNTAMQAQQHNGNVSIAAPSVGLMVVAPEFEVVHDSWEAFEEALKAYGKMTFQLYVIRSTTSVKRRNLKIAESAGRGDSGNLAALRRAGMDMGVSEVDTDNVVERTLIPEQYQWYSKSLKCTHGWKDRHRGTGKRGSGVVRSTSCPAKMCVTLQHRGSGPEDWKVVVTKHVRTHNHQLSKELYLYYTENRRIYDPELLAFGGDNSGAAKPSDLTSTHLSSLIDQAYQRSGLYRMLTSDDQSQQASSMAFIVSDPSSAVVSGNSVDNAATKQFVALSDANNGNFVIRPRSNTAPLAPMPPLGAMILTPGTIPSRAMDGGGFCVPRVSTKVHASWDAFHDYIAQYAFDTAQVFRTRSTVSIAARNAKIVASIAAKTGGEDHDVASYASYAAATPTSRLVPEEFKWFSKLLICTYGWKRRARGKSPRLEHDDGHCPAMLLARMERNVDGNWQVVINRQVPEHNHKLGGHEETGASNHEIIEAHTDTLTPAQSFESTPMQSPSVDCSSLMETQTITSEPSVEEPQIPSSSQREIVVRVPKLQSMFKSWDDFHASLKAYSDATYQLYRTRTTSSAKGRNKKITQMKRRGEEDENEVENNDNDSDVDTSLSGVNGARKIPESWRWYSKTLTCTHGWKERHRGTGKRNAHGVRSTACPVKICATVQYMNPSPRLENGTLSIENDDAASETYWRVVVTKHIVDHNHNLSRELYQHYCENRRIYDPELLAINTSNSNAVVTRKAGPGTNVQEATTDASRLIQHDASKMLPQPPVLPTQLEVGLAEAVNQAQLFGSTSNHPVNTGASGVAALPQTSTSGTGVQQPVPSVVLLPYNTTASYLPSQAQAQPQQLQQQQQHNQAVFTGATTGAQPQTSEGVATLAAAATPGLTPGNLVLLNNVGMSMSGYPPPGSNVISVACRVHGSSGGTTSNGNSSGSNSVNTASNQCTCFRIAGGGNYVTIVPASEPLASAETSFDVDDEAMLYAEEMEGAWQPSSNVEIEKVTTESGEFIWRVPRIVRRYPTWAVFHKYLDAYSAATFQLYRVRTTYSVRSRNTRLRQLAASRGLIVREGGNDAETEQDGANGMSRAHLVPEQYEWYSKTFLCTHGWKRRSRGSGQRVSHNVRATECPAKVCATLQRTDGSNNWSVVVTKHLAEHNHELSEALYQQYSEVRRVRDPEVLAQAEQLWRGGATRRRVFEFLKERSPNQIILMKDVHNLVQRWQTQERRQQGDNGDQEQAQEEQSGQNLPVAAHDEENSSWL